MYPKTLRVSNEKYHVTEKIDGSNLGIAKYNGELYYFTRNWIYSFDDLGDIGYKGLKLFTENHRDEIDCILEDNQVIFGEWIGQGRIKYNIDKTDTRNRFYAFAFAGLTPDSLEEGTQRFRYMKYVYKWTNMSKPKPEWLNFVPYLGNATTIHEAIALYSEVSLIDGESTSEGVIIVNGNNPQKYVVNKGEK